MKTTRPILGLTIAAGAAVAFGGLLALDPGGAQAQAADPAPAAQHFDP